MFGSHFKLISRTNMMCHLVSKFISQSHVKQFWSMFGSHFKHILRMNMLCHLVSKYMCRSNVKQFYIVFGFYSMHFSRKNMMSLNACADHMKSNSGACLDHISSTFQEQTCCVTQSQNTCANHMKSNSGAYLDHISSTFQEQTCGVIHKSISKYAASPSNKIHVPNTCKAILEQFGSHFTVLERCPKIPFA
jgi:hypothetical protein